MNVPLESSLRQPDPADSAALRADPLADATIARILGRGRAGGPDVALIALVNREIARWESNADLDGWRASPDVPADMAAALQDYVATARALPAWADTDKIARAEQLFMDVGLASCTLLFCASLPQCYVIPDLASVLHVAGQLEQHTDYRVRATAAMIFPVMLRGGLTAADGGGVAQALKVRLIHATIRHLVLRGDPADAMVAPRRLKALLPQGAGMHQLLYAHGWDIDRRGLPCNQEELAYTLLTFNYVFLQGLRRLGAAPGVTSADEEAYLHAWNVLGHVLGIERALMADTMAEAQQKFEAIQATARAQAQSLAPQTPDPRQALAAGLVGALQHYIPVRNLKPFPVLLTRRLIGKAAARDLGLDGHVSRRARFAFALGVCLVRTVDALGRLAAPDFSIARLVTRILGYRMASALLLDQTRPLKLPDALLGDVDRAVRGWQVDARAPRWMNAIERRFTGRARAPATPDIPVESADVEPHAADT
jgi:hypothetical protein